MMKALIVAIMLTMTGCATKPIPITKVKFPTPPSILMEAPSLTLEPLYKIPGKVTAPK